MTILRKVRSVASIVLLLAAVMPLSECSFDSHRIYAFEFVYGFGPAIGIITALAYIWPLVFVVLLRKRFGPRLRGLFQALELLLCAGSIYWIYQLALGGKWLYGAYTGISAVAVFTIAGAASWWEKSLTMRWSEPPPGACSDFR
jgi:hypothetical protein